MAHPSASDVVPTMAPLFVGEPLAIAGGLTIDDRAGFGIELDPNVTLHRPFPP
jgi:L-rhamnonate dehydratase